MPDGPSLLRGPLPRTVRRLADDASGNSAVEYGLIVGGIALAIVVALFAAGADISGFFQDTQEAMSNRTE